MRFHGGFVYRIISPTCILPTGGQNTVPGKIPPTYFSTFLILFIDFDHASSKWCLILSTHQFYPYPKHDFKTPFRTQFRMAPKLGQSTPKNTKNIKLPHCLGSWNRAFSWIDSDCLFMIGCRCMIDLGSLFCNLVTFADGFVIVLVGHPFLEDYCKYFS